MISTKASRRLLPAITVTALLAVAACNSSSDASENSNGDDLLPAAEGTTEYPLTVPTLSGDIELEERPERIAVLGFSSNMDAVEALGVTPVYALNEDAEWQWRDQDWMSEIELVDSVTRNDPLNFEGIASTYPDLIIATNYPFEEEDLDRLSDIAPVLQMEEEIPGDQVDWRDTQRFIGDTLDLSEAADTAVDEAEQEIAAIADDHPEFAGATITIAYDYVEIAMEYYTVTGGSAEQIVQHLGFEPNPLAEEFLDDAEVSDENLAKLDADVLLVFYGGDDVRQDREDMPLFQNLPPVEEGRYVTWVHDEDDYDPAGDASWVLRRGASALSVPWALDVIAGWVSEADLDE